MERFAPLIGRVLISLIFLSSGISKIFNFEATKAYMQVHGMPVTSALLIVAILIEVLGGLSLILGFKTRQGALALIIFIIPATLVFHMDFSNQVQIIQFMKNLAIAGGLFLLHAHGAGDMSLDGKNG